MKLPGINYQTAVGPDVSAVPLQNARSWANAADNWATAIDNVNQTLQEQQGNEAWAQASPELVEAEAITKRPVWDVAQMGEPDASLQIDTRNRLGPQPTYQMHEFGSQWHDRRIKAIRDKYGKGLSRGARRIFESKLNNYVAQSRVRVLENQHQQKMTHIEGVMRNSINTLTSQATFDNLPDTMLQVNEEIATGVKSGAIDNVEAEELMRRANGEATKSAVLFTVRNANSEEELESIESGVFNATVGGQPSRVRSEDIDDVLRAIDRQKREIDEQDEERHDQNFRMVVGNLGAFTDQDVMELVADGAINSTQANTIMRWKEDGKPTALSFEDPAATDYWKGQISRLRFGVGEEETLRERYERMQKDINAAMTGAYADGTPYQGMPITNTVGDAALEDLDQQYAKVLAHPEMKQVLADIRTYTGMDGIVDIDKSSNNRKAQLAFNKAAWGYYDRMTVDADMRQWFDDNKEAFNPENYSGGGEAARLRALGVPNSYFDGNRFDAREVVEWVETMNLPSEQERTIRDTLMPLLDTAPTEEEELINNTLPANSLIER